MVAKSTKVGAAHVYWCQRVQVAHQRTAHLQGVADMELAVGADQPERVTALLTS